MSRIVSVLLMCLLFAGLTGCGKNNLFGSAHKAGSSSDVKSLAADAYAAFQAKDYVKALEYYKKILDADPSSTEAIYGYSSSTLAESGLDISALVANLVKQTSAPSVNHLTPALSTIAKASAPATNILPQSIIDNLPKIRAAVARVLQSDLLPKIIKGTADGVIAPDSADANINTAFCLILRAATNVQDAGIFTVNSDYTFVNIKSGLTAAEKQVMVDASKDIASAFQRLKTVYEKLNLGNDSSVADIKKDVDALLTNLKSQSSLAGVTLADINTDYL